MSKSSLPPDQVGVASHNHNGNFLDYHSACWKKTAKGESRPSSNLISGPKYCGDPPEPNPNQIRLMSYNMFGWNALHDPQKTENMFRIIRAFNPDILGTQEDENMSDEIASNIGSDYRLEFIFLNSYI